ncbi:MAG: exosortase/archaeosortase family protein [Candidatus Omnitrophota bacterium]
MKKKMIFLAIGLILFPVILIYRSTFLWLFERYTAADTYYSHGFLVPLVTGVLIWLKRDELKGKKWEFSRLGLSLIIISLMIHFLSIMLEVFFVSGFSILMLVFGISLFLFGRNITKKILFPLSFLIFMFPLPLVAINAISFPMKLFVTRCVVFVLQSALNFPVRNEGFEVFFPNGTMVVENPCSGLRSLIVMLALGSIFAYLLKEKAIKRIALFLCTIPIALIANISRVLLLSLVLYIYGPETTKGFIHDFSGFLMFAIAFVGLWLLWGVFQCKDSG